MVLKYPHMLPADVILWERFLSRHKEEFDRFEYDVHIGKVKPIYPTSPVNLMKLAEAVSRKRIDVVAWRGEIAFIIEVKPYAGLSALGQLLGYEILYKREYPGAYTLRLGVVTDRLDEDMEVLFDHYNIHIWVV